MLIYENKGKKITKEFILNTDLFLERLLVMAAYKQHVIVLMN